MNDPTSTAVPLGRKVARRLRQEARDRWKLLKWRLYNVGRHPKPFATHLPILVGLPRLRKIRKVIEFGSGPFSTGAFLDPQIYPDLVLLQSHDDDPIWHEKVQAENLGQQKLTLSLVGGPISGAVRDADLSGADLIFVDDSKTRDARSDTIRAVCERLGDRAWLVIHDFEVKQYQTASSSVAYRYVFKTFKPYVGVLWNAHQDYAPALSRLERQIRANKREIPIDDMRAWHDVLNAAQAIKEAKK